ncbi:ATP-binding cassette subfamily B protein [Arcicella rosea]|uniref:peptidase domain-containing ABC transporter n=1 Tax=Arcicella rosea TaxID=502909 RepID=UPI00345CF53C
MKNNTSKNLSQQTKGFMLQQDESDCGVACLLSIIRYHGGENTLECLRESSGTSIQGTSLLGLKQSANSLNLQAEAFEVDDLEVFKKQASFPCILHVVIDEKLEHYIVCYEASTNGSFIIGDPAKGIEIWTEEELLSCWKTRAVLILSPTEAFEKVPQNNQKKIAWFKELLRDDTSMLVIAAVLGIALAVLGMATAIFSQKLLDEIIPKHQTQRLWLGMALLGFLLLARAGLGYLRGFFLLRQSKDFNNRLMDDFYDKFLHLHKSFFDTRKTGEIIARLNDTRRIQQVISYLVGNVVIDILVLLVSAVYVFNYSVTVGLLSLLSLPLFGCLIWKYNDRIIKNQKGVMSQYASTESHFVDAITGISVIKATNKESMFVQVGKIYYQLFQQKIYELGTLSNRYGFWSEILNALLITTILSVSSFAVLHKDIKIGAMMATISIASGMIGAVSRLSTTNIQLQEAKVAFERMYEFASIKPENDLDVKYDITELEDINSLTVNSLSFRFAGRTQLLKKVSLFLRKGTMVTLLGEVGSGKSVLLQILQKFQHYEEGEISVNDNLAFKNIAPDVWRRKIGVVPQDVKIFNGTLIDNIILGNVMDEGQKAVDFCKSIGLDRFFENLPQGYLTIVGEEGINLSGGQKQLVALARALYRKPNLLLLDEATSAMDNNTENFVLNLLEKLKSEIGIFMVTHRNSIAEKSDNIYVLENGVIEEMTFCV